MGATADHTVEPGVATAAAATPADDIREQMLLAGIATFALYHLLIAAWMAASPHTFFTALGPFGAYDAHYIRDTATFEAALGVGLLVALRRRAWRVPALAIVTLQFGLHSINHLVDAQRADPRWVGWFDFGSLSISTLLLAWLWSSAIRFSRERRAS